MQKQHSALQHSALQHSALRFHTLLAASVPTHLGTVLNDDLSCNLVSYIVTSSRCVKFRGNSKEPWKMLVSVVGLRQSMRTLGSWCCSPLWPCGPQLSGVLLGIFKWLSACSKLAVVETVCRSLMSDQTPERRPGLDFAKITAILRQKEIKSDT